MWPGTTSRRCLGLIVAICCLTGGDPMGPAALGQSALTWSGQDTAGTGTGLSTAGISAEQSADPLSRCERAAVAAEQASGLPSGLLLAIGRVESGRWDATRGRMTAWPWTINAAGKGQWFETKDAAVRTVRTLLDGGMRSIDTGCFQISMLWHPMAFDSLEQAFEPDANARYAAHFLLSLFGQTGSWEAAVQAYHSADPALGFAYRQQVFSTWLAAAPVTLAAVGAVRAGTAAVLTFRSHPEPAAMPVVIAGVRIWSPMPAGSAANVVAMPATQASPPAAGLPAQLPVVSYRRMPPAVMPTPRAMDVMPRR
jgi:hypothetical protein